MFFSAERYSASPGSLDFARVVDARGDRFSPWGRNRVVDERPRDGDRASGLSGPVSVPTVETVPPATTQPRACPVGT